MEKERRHNTGGAVNSTYCISDISMAHIGTGTSCYFTFEICHQLKCCSAIGLIGVRVLFLRTGSSKVPNVKLVMLRGRTFGKQVERTKEAVTFYAYMEYKTLIPIRLSELWHCVSDSRFRPSLPR